MNQNDKSGLSLTQRLRQNVAGIAALTLLPIAGYATKAVETAVKSPPAIVQTIVVASAPTYLVGCSSTGPDEDYNHTFAPYNVAYDNGRNGVKQVFADDAKLDKFAGALMAGDLTGYSKDEVKSMLRQWVDGEVSNEELFFGIGVTDEGEMVNGKQTGTIAFKFGYNNERPSYTSQVTKIPQEKMWEIHEVFPPYQ